MALEGLNLGIKLSDIKKKEKEEPKTIKFKLNTRANGEVDLSSEVAKFLDSMPKDRAVDLWKVYYIRKTHTAEQAKNYKEICDYLSQKYGISIPKRK